MGNVTEGTGEESKKWWEEPIPAQDEETTGEAETVFDAELIDEEQLTGIQKFMNISVIPHDNVAKEIAHQVKEGIIDPIQVYIALKRVAKIEEICLDSQKGDKELREIILNKVRQSLNGGKNIDMYGANLRIQATGTRYEFDNCGDSVLNKLLEIEKEVKARIKQRQDLIKVVLPPDDTKALKIRSHKLLQQGMPSLEWSDDEWDENIFPAIKLAGESVICTFKKEK